MESAAAKLGFLIGYKAAAAPYTPARPSLVKGVMKLTRSLSKLTGKGSTRKLGKRSLSARKGWGRLTPARLKRTQA